MRTLFKVLLLMAVGAVVTRVAAFVVSSQLDEGSEVSDEFRRLVIFNGLDFSSRARGLRSAEVSVVVGGAKVDLRNATIDPEGARILIDNTLGGLMLTVRDDWAVTVNETLVGGGETEINVTPIEELPGDAPRVQVDVISRLGGTVISGGSTDN